MRLSPCHAASTPGSESLVTAMQELQSSNSGSEESSVTEELKTTATQEGMTKDHTLAKAEPAKRGRMATELASRLNRISTGRAIFRTEESYLGNGPQAVLPGDQVWIVAGAATPLVLRPRENGRFSMIGEAYVHGIMKGEAFEREDFEMRAVELE